MIDALRESFKKWLQTRVVLRAASVILQEEAFLAYAAGASAMKEKAAQRLIGFRDRFGEDDSWIIDECLAAILEIT